MAGLVSQWVQRQVLSLHPDILGLLKKLVVCDTISCSPANAGIDDVFGIRIEAARAAGNMVATTEQMMERWFGRAWLDGNPGEAQRMRGLMTTTTVDGFETCCHALRSQSFDLRPLYTKVGAGVEEALLVVGENDANSPQTMSEMRDKIEDGFVAVGKDSKVEPKIIQNAGHVCYIDGFEQFCQVVSPFLQR
jgi:3-oxoadipate enol-lactonase